MATINDTLWRDGRTLQIGSYPDGETLVIIRDGKGHEMAGGSFPTDLVRESMGLREGESGFGNPASQETADMIVDGLARTVEEDW